MSNVNVIRAWKDESYRLSLSEAERALLPENPAGLVDIKEDELDQVNGGLLHCTCCCCCCTCYQ
jgi:mersacidin/lichenicidin family type 2 lantibiotic